MLHELALGGLLFSPLVVFALLALLMALATRLLLHKLALGKWIWKDAWFDVSLFVCYLALAVYLLGD
ncbi:DUF1656 domain-containing protein [Gallaecimonas xiamenensis]|uniref:Efflux system membrane protein n=1 Tax=Gallaecimonas xiamenensis 3-C-1 TaxID=745411 RepID=K2IZJ5_9GAMM|nr:DUF1656 domain-containing protein [Gallaecimonas xiamenensis]EKE75981.1 hypothetical protein B3C1_05962 [Gallaecimonas xiamenensis 3-C-1]